MPEQAMRKSEQRLPFTSAAPALTLPHRPTRAVAVIIVVRCVREAWHCPTPAPFVGRCGWMIRSFARMSANHNAAGVPWRVKRTSRRRTPSTSAREEHVSGCPASCSAPIAERRSLRSVATRNIAGSSASKRAIDGGNEQASGRWPRRCSGPAPARSGLTSSLRLLGLRGGRGAPGASMRVASTSKRLSLEPPPARSSPKSASIASRPHANGAWSSGRQSGCEEPPPAR